MVYDLSWANALLLSASIPSFKKKDKDKEPAEAISTADAAALFGN